MPPQNSLLRYCKLTADGVGYQWSHANGGPESQITESKLPHIDCQNDRKKRRSKSTLVSKHLVEEVGMDRNGVEATQMPALFFFTQIVTNATKDDEKVALEYVCVSGE